MFLNSGQEISLSCLLQVLLLNSYAIDLSNSQNPALLSDSAQPLSDKNGADYFFPL